MFAQLHQQLSQRILGQEPLITRLLVALIANGHLLVEGAPGLAKTTAIKTLAEHLEADFQRQHAYPQYHLTESLMLQFCQVVLIA